MRTDYRPIKNSYLTVSEAAETAKKYPQTIYYHIHQGNIRHRRFGVNIYVSKSALMKFYGIEKGGEKWGQLHIGSSKYMYISLGNKCL